MGRYVSDHLCLDCRAVVSADAVCPRCGLVQIGLEADELRGLLTAADDVLSRARAHTQHPPAPSPACGNVGRPPMTAPLLPPLPPRRPARSLPAFSTPVVLLGLGAVCVFVAAIVFVSVSWSDLSLAAKAAILLVVTAGVGGAVAWSLHKVLRGSAEAFATLFALMVPLDFVAAHSSGLAGLDALSSTAAEYAASLLMLLSGGGWALGARNSGIKKLVGAQLVAALGVAGLAVATFDLLEQWRTEHVALALFALVAATALSARRLLAEFALAVGIIAVLLFAIAWVTSLGRLIEHSTLAELWRDLAALGWLVCCALLGAAGAVPRLPPPLRHLAASVSVAGVTLLLLRPLEGSGIDTVIAVCAGAALALCLAGAFVVTRGPWHTATSVAAAGPFALSAVLVVPSPVEALARAVSPAGRAWQLASTSPTVGLESGVVRGNAPVVAVVLVALVVSGWVLLRGRLPTVWTGGLLIAAAAAVVVLRRPLPLWQAVAVLGGLTVACAVVALVRRTGAPAAAAAGLAALTLLASLGSELTTIVIGLLITGALTLVTVRREHNRPRGPFAGGAVVMGALTFAAGLATLGLGQRGIALGLVLLGGLVLVAAQAQRGPTALPVRHGLELGAVAVMVVALGLSVRYVALLLPVAMTVTGLALASVALLRADRRLLTLPAGVLFAGASWVRLWAEDVTVIEAYTLPSAVVLCALGIRRLRRAPAAASMTALGPGLALVFLPSLAAALPEPTSPRALLLGLSALGVLLVGAWLRWAAPLILGSTTALALVLVNIAPYAAALPRWVIFAVAGVGLLFLGVTWERRLRDARTLTAATLRLH